MDCSATTCAVFYEMAGVNSYTRLVDGLSQCGVYKLLAKMACSCPVV